MTRYIRVSIDRVMNWELTTIRGCTGDTIVGGSILFCISNGQLHVRVDERVVLMHISK